MSKVIFATGATTDSLSGKVREVTHATVERIQNAGFDGVEIVNRCGQKLTLDIDAARQLAWVLRETKGF
jgi:hypothetical protein